MKGNRSERKLNSKLVISINLRYYDFLDLVAMNGYYWRITWDSFLELPMLYLEVLVWSPPKPKKVPAVVMGEIAVPFNDLKGILNQSNSFKSIFKILVTFHFLKQGFYLEDNSLQVERGPLIYCDCSIVSCERVLVCNIFISLLINYC